MKSIICEWLIEIGILAVVCLHPEELDYELDSSELRVYVCVSACVWINLHRPNQAHVPNRFRCPAVKHLKPAAPQNVADPKRIRPSQPCRRRRTPVFVIEELYGTSPNWCDTFRCHVK